MLRSSKRWYVERSNNQSLVHLSFLIRRSPIVLELNASRREPKPTDNQAGSQGKSSEMELYLMTCLLIICRIWRMEFIVSLSLHFDSFLFHMGDQLVHHGPDPYCRSLFNSYCRSLLYYPLYFLTSLLAYLLLAVIIVLSRNTTSSRENQSIIFSADHRVYSFPRSLVTNPYSSTSWFSQPEKRTLGRDASSDKSMNRLHQGK